MVMKQPFTTATPFVVSYDRTDAETGVGYVDYNGFSTRDNTTIDHHLIRGTPWSDTVETTAAQSSAGSSTKDLDVDFDYSPQTIAQTIKGEAIIQFSSGITAPSTTSKYFIRIRIRKFDGSTETEIATSRNQEVTHGGANWQTQSNTLAITVPETILSVGDVLRVTVEGWIQDGSTSCEMAISHSPKNLSTGNITGIVDDPDADADANRTTFIASIPYKLDI
jgi:hypothetical protein